MEWRPPTPATTTLCTVVPKIFSVIIAVFLLACMEQQAPDNSKICKSLWKCGSSNLFHVTLQASGIGTWLVDFFWNNLKKKWGLLLIKYKSLWGTIYRVVQEMRRKEARKCSAAQGPHNEVVPHAFWRLVLKSCDECKGSFARGCEAKQWPHWTCSSLGTIFQPVRINSVPDVKCFCNNKNVLRAQSMVWHFVRHPVH